MAITVESQGQRGERKKDTDIYAEPFLCKCVTRGWH